MADRIITAIFTILFGVGRVLPRSAALNLGRFLGTTGYFLTFSRRRLALDNLHHAIGKEYSRGELRIIARRSFANLGKTFMEYLSFPSFTRGNIEEMVSFNGLDHLQSALDTGRGVLVLSAHLDNVDLLSVALAMKGYPIGSIVKNVRPDAVNRILISAREAAGVRVFAGSGNMRDILRHLNDGGIVGFVLDQNARRTEGVFVPFFGRQASTLNSLAVLARRRGTCVVPVYIYRDGSRHTVVVEPPINSPPNDNRDDDILERTRQYTAWIEKIIRRHPDQWMWVHNRWRIQPLGEEMVQRPTSKVSSPKLNSVSE